MIKNFFTSFSNSIYNPSWYQKIASGLVPFKSSVFYGLKLVFLASFIFWLIFSLLISGLYFVLKTSIPLILEFYPTELELNITDGVVSTNVQSPYFIPLVKDKLAVSTSTLDNVLVIDIDNQLSYEKFLEYKTLALIAKEQVMFTEPDGTIRIVSLHKFFDTKINSEQIQKWSVEADFWLKLILILTVLLFLPFVFIVTLFLGALVLSVLTLIIWGVMRLTNFEVGYQEAYQIGIHASTLPLALFLFTFLVPIVSFSFWFLILILLAVVGFNLSGRIQ